MYNQDIFYYKVNIESKNLIINYEFYIIIRYTSVVARLLFSYSTEHFPLFLVTNLKP